MSTKAVIHMASFDPNVDHNEAVLADLRKGDLVEFPRGFYSHWAVYTGNGKVTHLTGRENQRLTRVRPNHLLTFSGQRFDKAEVRIDHFWDAAKESKALKNNGRDLTWRKRSKSEIVQTAVSRVGEKGYNILCFNCEHFAKWCRYGKQKSDQVKYGLKNCIKRVGKAMCTCAGNKQGQEDDENVDGYCDIGGKSYYVECYDEGEEFYDLECYNEGDEYHDMVLKYRDDKLLMN